MVTIPINFRMSILRCPYCVLENGGISEYYTGKKDKRIFWYFLGGIPLYIRIYDIMLYLVLLSIFSEKLMN